MYHLQNTNSNKMVNTDLLQSQIEILQLNLKQAEESRQIYKNLMEQDVKFIERVHKRVLNIMEEKSRKGLSSAGRHRVSRSHSVQNREVHLHGNKMYHSLPRSRSATYDSEDENAFKRHHMVGESRRMCHAHTHQGHKSRRDYAVDKDRQQLSSSGGYRFSSSSSVFSTDFSPIPAVNKTYVRRVRSTSQIETTEKYNSYKNLNMVCCKSNASANQSLHNKDMHSDFLHSQLENLQWQLNQAEASRQMYRSLMEQDIKFLRSAHKSLLDIMAEKSGNESPSPPIPEFLQEKSQSVQVADISSTHPNPDILMDQNVPKTRKIWHRLMKLKSLFQSKDSTRSTIKDVNFHDRTSRTSSSSIFSFRKWVRSKFNTVRLSYKVHSGQHDIYEATKQPDCSFTEDRTNLGRTNQDNCVVPNSAYAGTNNAVQEWINSLQHFNFQPE